MDDCTKWRKMGFDQAVALLRARAKALDELIVDFTRQGLAVHLDNWRRDAATIRALADDLEKRWVD